MMSPLALLNEGEMAEIVSHPEGNGHSHPHRHGRVSEASGGHASKLQNGCCGGVAANCQSGEGPHVASGHHHEHLQNMGLRSGKQVQMITNSGSGPLILRVDECRIAMARGAAMKIYVRRIEG